MKKLTKKSLDELARVMPVISEAKQRVFFGGTWYYDTSGTLVGFTPDESDEIRVVNSTWGTGDTLKFSEASQETQGKILSTIGQSAGISGTVQIYGVSNQNEYAKYSHNNDIVGVNSSGSFYGSGNYYDFLSMLIHESYHQSNRWDGSDRNELEALLYQMNHYTFGKTSAKFQSGVLAEYNKLLTAYNGL